jgi:hypothetical protein
MDMPTSDVKRAATLHQGDTFQGFTHQEFCKFCPQDSAFIDIVNVELPTYFLPVVSTLAHLIFAHINFKLK